MDQPDKAANSARGQLKREMNISLYSFAPDLARRVRPSRPASAGSFSILRLNLVLTLLPGFLPISAAHLTDLCCADCEA